MWTLLSQSASQQLTRPDKWPETVQRQSDKNRGDKSTRCPNRTEWVQLRKQIFSLKPPFSHSEWICCFFLFIYFLLVPFPPLLHSLAFFPRFQMNVLLTLFFHLTLRDGLSHLKLNTRPGATLIQPSVRPSSFSPFFPFSLLAMRGEKIVQRGKRAVRLTLSSQRGKMHLLKIKSSPDC